MRCFLGFFISFLFCVSGFAATDSTRIAGYPLFPGDTAQRINLFHNIPWQVSITERNGNTVMLTTTKPDTAFKNRKFTKVWLSASFRVPRSLLQQVFYVHFETDGSLLIKQNNRSVLATGNFQKNKQSELRKLTQDQFCPLYFEDSLQRMELIFIPRPQLHTFELSLEIYPRVEAEQKIQHAVADEKDSAGKGFYYLAFGIVFFVFYLYFREKVENLYFSLFCLCAAYAFLWDEVYHDALFNMEGFPGIFSFEFLSIFFCKVLKNRERSRIPLIVISVITAFTLLPVIRYNYIDLGTVYFPWALGLIYLTLYAFVTISSIYYLVSGLGQKRWEARIILVICLAPIALLIFSFISFIVVYGVIKPDKTFNVIVVQCIDYFISLIVYVYPLAAVLILGRRNGLNQKQLIAQIASIQQLSEENLQKEQEKKELLEKQNEALEHEVALRTAEITSQKERIEKQHEELKEEKKKSDDLLRNILPEEIAEELKQTGHSDAKLFDNVTVLFADFVNFTKAGESMTPQMLVNELHTCFKAFDEIISKYQIEKIKTIGDAYLAVCGLPLPVEDHAIQIVKAATEIRDFMAERKAIAGNNSFEIRLGVHSGPVVAGIVGVKKFAYDIWGDTVNTAARMEQSSEPGQINISDATYQLVKEHVLCSFRGDIAVKNKGILKMYYVQHASGNT